MFVGAMVQRKGTVAGSGCAIFCRFRGNLGRGTAKHENSKLPRSTTKVCRQKCDGRGEVELLVQPQGFTMYVACDVP